MPPNPFCVFCASLWLPRSALRRLRRQQRGGNTEIVKLAAVVTVNTCKWRPPSEVAGDCRLSTDPTIAPSAAGHNFNHPLRPDEIVALNGGVVPGKASESTPSNCLRVEENSKLKTFSSSLNRLPAMSPIVLADPRKLPPSRSMISIVD